MKYRGLLYRALNPRYAVNPLSGRGAEMFGGRFNALGTPALYLSLFPETAIRETNQIGTLQPTMLVAYEATLATVFNTQDAAALSEYRFTSAMLADPSWRDRMRSDGMAPTQDLAAQLVAAGYEGMLVRSFAKGARKKDLNLVLWSWSPASIRVIDDEDRLGR